jgi:hypothetical protein
MVHRPYHDYSAAALRDLSRDLASSQAQLEDQRADWVKRAGPENEDLRELDVLVSDLGNHLAAVDQELATRRRERAASAVSGHRGAGLVRRHVPQVVQSNAKPHCRAKTAAVATRR